MSLEPLYHGPGAFSAVHVYRGDASSSSGLVARSEKRTLIQVAADTRESLLLQLRAIRSDAFLDEEVLGGRIGAGREAFGFRDGIHTPTREEVDRLAIGPEGSWLLYLRFEQDLSRFSALPIFKQENVMGVTTEGVPIPKPPPGAHVPLAREYGHFVRRGFPYRKDNREGLIFIAAARQRATLERAYAAFREHDALRPYAQVVSEGFFFVSR